MGSVAGASHFKGAQLVIGAEHEAETYDARFLISTLLVYVAKSDGSISALESNRMIDLLAAQLSIPTPEALDRLSGAIMSLSNDKEIAKTLQQISQSLSDNEKKEIFAMMVEVVVIDEKLEPGEIEAVTLAGQILGLSLDTIHGELRAILLAQKNS